MNIRLLTQQDLTAFRAIRLRGLQESPEAFGMTEEEFLQIPPSQTAERIRIEGNPPERFVLGAFDHQHNLIGVVGLIREKRIKTRHRATIWGMYVAPEGRGQGLGKLLLQDLLNRCSIIPGLEQIHLAVVTTNTAARHLYTSLGFRVYGLEPHALKHHEQHYDEELMVFPLSSFPINSSLDTLDR
jgi:ribosomal protein S18 acetylase RimI-like enzyme